MDTHELREAYADDIREEEARVERLMTAREIFAAGFKLGLSNAGLTEDADGACDDWLLARSEAKV